MAKKMTEKKTAKKNDSKTKVVNSIATKKDGQQAPTLKKAHALMAELLAAAPVDPQAAALGAARPSAAAAAEKTVSFTLTNIGCVGVITSGNISFGITGGSKIGHLFPVGVDDLFYAVKGPKNQAFAISLEGGTLDKPIDSKLTADGKAGGSRKLTVDA